MLKDNAEGEPVDIILDIIHQSVIIEEKGQRTDPGCRYMGFRQIAEQPIQKEVDQVQYHDDYDKIPKELFSVPEIDNGGQDIELHFYPEGPIYEWRPVEVPADHNRPDARMDKTKAGQEIEDRMSFRKIVFIVQNEC